MEIFAVGLPVTGGVQQEHFFTPLTGINRSLWEPTLHGISYDHWCATIRQEDPGATDAEIRRYFLTLRQARLLTDWPLRYDGTPGPSLTSLRIVAPDSAIPEAWPHRALWNASLPLSTVVQRLADEWQIPGWTVVHTLIPQLLHHPDVYWIDLLTTPVVVVTR